MRLRVVPGIALGALLTAPGCAGTQHRTLGSPDLIARPVAAQSSPEEAFGHQIIVLTHDDRIYAELVGCDEQFVYLHVNDASALAWTALPWGAVEKADVHNGGSGRITAITFLVVGSVSTISHGLLGVFSAPVWAAVGVPSLFWSLGNAHVKGRCPELNAYSRYPEGLPPVIRERYWGPGADGPHVEPLPVAPLPVAPLP
jgi:hypothetical protein